MVKFSPILLAGVSLCSVAAASSAIARDLGRPMAPEPQVLYANEATQVQAPVQRASARGQMGGGFIEFLFNGNDQPGAQRPQHYQQPQYYQPQQPVYQHDPRMMPPMQQDYAPQNDALLAPAQPAVDPRFDKQLVDYNGKEAPGTIVIDTPNKFLYLVQDGGRAMRYGVGVGKPGFTWAGVKHITNKREWPDWVPPPEMLKRRPDLPRHMEGGPQNPLGARAMYLGSSLYRIHGSNEPWTIGTAVSSGCIRMRNEDVIELYGRVKVGTRVIVI